MTALWVQTSPRQCLALDVAVLALAIAVMAAVASKDVAAANEVAPPLPAQLVAAVGAQLAAEPNGPKHPIQLREPQYFC